MCYENFAVNQKANIFVSYVIKEFAHAFSCAYIKLWMHLGSFPACIHNSIYMHAKHEQILNCHCFNISHITSNRTFWGLIFGSEIFWVLIFTLGSHGLLLLWEGSNKYVHVCTLPACIMRESHACGLKTFKLISSIKDNLSRQLTHKCGQNVLWHRINNSNSLNSISTKILQKGIEWWLFVLTKSKHT